MKMTGGQKVRRLCQGFLCITIVWGLYACGSTGENRKNIVPDTAMEDETADFANEEATNEANDEGTHAESKADAEGEEANESSAAIAEQVLLEEKGVKITALEMVEDVICCEL